MGRKWWTMFSILDASKVSQALAAAGQPVADEIVQKALDSLQADEQIALSALEPALDELEQKGISEVVALVLPALETSLVSKVIPALQEALTNTLDGLTVTITISRKGK